MPATRERQDERLDWGHHLLQQRHWELYPSVSAKVGSTGDGARMEPAEGRAPGGSTPRAIRLLVAGLAAILVAGWGLAGKGSSDNQPEAVAADVVTIEEGASMPGPVGVAATAATYEPGMESGWHSHDGLHAVVVTAGRLTVYDERCTAAVYTAGQVYVGGRQAHLARNETDSPVEMAVTYVSPLGGDPRHFRVAAESPVNCAVGR